MPDLVAQIRDLFEHPSITEEEVLARMPKPIRYERPVQRAVETVTTPWRKSREALREWREEKPSWYKHVGGWLLEAGVDATEVAGWVLSAPVSVPFGVAALAEEVQESGLKETAKGVGLNLTAEMRWGYRWLTAEGKAEELGIPVEEYMGWADERLSQERGPGGMGLFGKALSAALVARAGVRAIGGRGVSLKALQAAVEKQQSQVAAEVARTGRATINLPGGRAVTMNAHELAALGRATRPVDILGRKTTVWRGPPRAIDVEPSFFEQAPFTRVEPGGLVVKRFVPPRVVGKPGYMFTRTHIEAPAESVSSAVKALQEQVRAVAPGVSTPGRVPVVSGAPMDIRGIAAAIGRLAPEQRLSLKSLGRTALGLDVPDPPPPAEEAAVAAPVRPSTAAARTPAGAQPLVEAALSAKALQPGKPTPSSAAAAVRIQEAFRNTPLEEMADHAVYYAGPKSRTDYSAVQTSEGVRFIPEIHIAHRIARMSELDTSAKLEAAEELAHAMWTMRRQASPAMIRQFETAADRAFGSEIPERWSGVMEAASKASEPAQELMAIIASRHVADPEALGSLIAAEPKHPIAAAARQAIRIVEAPMDWEQALPGMLAGAAPAGAPSVEVREAERTADAAAKAGPERVRDEIAQLRKRAADLRRQYARVVKREVTAVSAPGTEEKTFAKPAEAQTYAAELQKQGLRPTVVRRLDTGEESNSPAVYQEYLNVNRQLLAWKEHAPRKPGETVAGQIDEVQRATGEDIAAVLESQGISDIAAANKSYKSGSTVYVNPEELGAVLSGQGAAVAGRWLRDLPFDDALKSAPVARIAASNGLILHAGADWDVEGVALGDDDVWRTVVAVPEELLKTSDANELADMVQRSVSRLQSQVNPDIEYLAAAAGSAALAPAMKLLFQYPRVVAGPGREQPSVFMSLADAGLQLPDGWRRHAVGKQVVYVQSEGNVETAETEELWRAKSLLAEWRKAGARAAYVRQGLRGSVYAADFGDSTAFIPAADIGSVAFAAGRPADSVSFAADGSHVRIADKRGTFALVETRNVYSPIGETTDAGKALVDMVSTALSLRVSNAMSRHQPVGEVIRETMAAAERLAATELAGLLDLKTLRGEVFETAARRLEAGRRYEKLAEGVRATPWTEPGFGKPARLRPGWAVLYDGARPLVYIRDSRGRFSTARKEASQSDALERLLESAGPESYPVSLRFGKSVDVSIYDGENVAVCSADAMGFALRAMALTGVRGAFTYHANAEGDIVLMEKGSPACVIKGHHPAAAAGYWLRTTSQEPGPWSPLTYDVNVGQVSDPAVRARMAAVMGASRAEVTTGQLHRLLREFRRSLGSAGVGALGKAQAEALGAAGAAFSQPMAFDCPGDIWVMLSRYNVRVSQGRAAATPDEWTNIYREAWHDARREPHLQRLVSWLRRNPMKSLNAMPDFSNVDEAESYLQAVEAETPKHSLAFFEAHGGMKRADGLVDLTHGAPSINLKMFRYFPEDQLPGEMPEVRMTRTPSTEEATVAVRYIVSMMQRKKLTPENVKRMADKGRFGSHLARGVSIERLSPDDAVDLASGMARHYDMPDRDFFAGYPDRVLKTRMGEDMYDAYMVMDKRTDDQLDILQSAAAVLHRLRRKITRDGERRIQAYCAGKDVELSPFERRAVQAIEAVSDMGRRYIRFLRDTGEADNQDVTAGLMEGETIKEWASLADVPWSRDSWPDFLKSIVASGDDDAIIRRGPRGLAMRHWLPTVHEAVAGEEMGWLGRAWKMFVNSDVCRRIMGPGWARYRKLATGFLLKEVEYTEPAVDDLWFRAQLAIDQTAAIVRAAHGRQFRDFAKSRGLYLPDEKRYLQLEDGRTVGLMNYQRFVPPRISQYVQWLTAPVGPRIGKRDWWRHGRAVMGAMSRLSLGAHLSGLWSPVANATQSMLTISEFGFGEYFAGLGKLVRSLLSPEGRRWLQSKVMREMGLQTMHGQQPLGPMRTAGALTESTPAHALTRTLPGYATLPFNAVEWRNKLETSLLARHYWEAPGRRRGVERDAAGLGIAPEELIQARQRAANIKLQFMRGALNPIRPMVMSYVQQALPGLMQFQVFPTKSISLLHWWVQEKNWMKLGRFLLLHATVGLSFKTIGIDSRYLAGWRSLWPLNRVESVGQVGEEALGPWPEHIGGFVLTALRGAFGDPEAKVKAAMYAAELLMDGTPGSRATRAFIRGRWGFDIKRAVADYLSRFARGESMEFQTVVANLIAEGLADRSVPGWGSTFRGYLGVPGTEDRARWDAREALSRLETEKRQLVGDFMSHLKAAIYHSGELQGYGRLGQNAYRNEERMLAELDAAEAVSGRLFALMPKEERIKWQTQRFRDAKESIIAGDVMSWLLHVSAGELCRLKAANPERFERLGEMLAEQAAAYERASGLHLTRAAREKLDAIHKAGHD